MFEQDVVKPGYLLGYILALLSLSWLVTGLVASGLLAFRWLVLLPFLPGILALLFLSLEGHPIEVHARPLLGRITLPPVLFAVIYPLLLIGLAALVTLGTGLGYLNTGTGAGTTLAGSLGLAVVAFLSAIPASLGQEYGYRGYLLPNLAYWQGRTPATLSVGTVWGLVTAPVAWVALSAAGSGDAPILAVLMFLLVVAVSFAFTCCATLSASVLPVTLMNVLLLVAVPVFLPASWNPRFVSGGGLIGMTWPSPLPLLLLVALAFIPVFLWLFPEMGGEIPDDGL